MSRMLLTLRHNMTLEADVALAQAEIAAICHLSPSAVRMLNSSAELHSWLLANTVLPETIEYCFITRTSRRNGTTALTIEEATQEQFCDVIERAAFIQEALLIDSPCELKCSPLIHSLARVRAISPTCNVARGIPIATMLEYSATLVFRRDRVGSVSKALDTLVELLLNRSRPPANIELHLHDALVAKKTTLYLSHELHLYKGKFFPRLVHSLINRYASPQSTGLVCDPFAGSGTALLEASLLGYQSVGIDVDPTSVLISQHKTALDSVNCEELQRVCESMQAATRERQPSLFFEEPGYSLVEWERYIVRVPEPMRYRLAKRGNEEGYDLLGEIENDSAKALCLIAQVPAHLQSLFRVCLSHALTKKIRLRFVGIGNGRFTFDVAKTRVLDMFLTKAYHMLATAEAFDWLNQRGVHLGEIQVHRDSATHLDEIVQPGSVDLVVTSPPYIPASSGREHYARARAIPLVLTGAATVDELEELDRQFIGEMSGQVVGTPDIQDMPEAVRRTLSFLSGDAQRLPKYLPTLQYYRDIREVLRKVRRALSEDGCALFVVAQSHTFYVHKTKSVLHTVEAARAICEIGEQVGLRVAEIIDVPLAKSGGLNARPRSTDAYAEAVIVFRR